MKMQAAQIMLSNEGLHTNLSTNCIDHGSIELDAFTHTPEEEKTANEMLEQYKFEGAIIETHHHDKGLPTEFKTFTLKAYLSDIK